MNNLIYDINNIDLSNDELLDAAYLDYIISLETISITNEVLR